MSKYQTKTTQYKISLGYRDMKMFLHYFCPGSLCRNRMVWTTQSIMVNHGDILLFGSFQKYLHL